MKRTFSIITALLFSAGSSDAVKTFLYESVDATVYYAGVINNGLYVFGGRTQADQISSDMWVYDLPSLTWNKINYATPNDKNGNPSITARERAVSIVYGDLFWIIGGTRNASAVASSSEISANGFDSVYYYDYADQSLVLVPSRGTPIPKSFGHAATVLDGIFYFFGHYSFSATDPCGAGGNEIYEFHPNETEWRIVPVAGTRPQPRFGAALASFKGLDGWPQSLIVFGGAENRCGKYFNDMWRINFNDISDSSQTPSWEPLNYTSFSTVEPFGQAFMQVAVEEERVYVYGGVRGNLMRSVLENVWEYNAKTNYWRPVVKVNDAAPYACGSFTNSPGRPDVGGSISYNGAKNYTGGLFWAAYGGYSDVTRTPYRVGDKVNVLFNPAPPFSLLTSTQILWLSVLGPIGGVFLILLFVFLYRRSQDQAYTRLDANYRGNFTDMSQLREGEVPEDAANFFQNLQKANQTQSQMTGSVKTGGESVYAGPAGSAQGNTAMGGFPQQFPGGTAYGNNTGATAYGATAYGGTTSFGSTVYGAQAVGTQYGLSWSTYGGASYASINNGSTLIGEVASIGSGTNSAVSTIPLKNNQTIIGEIGGGNNSAVPTLAIPRPNDGTVIGEVGYAFGSSGNNNGTIIGEVYTQPMISRNNGDMEYPYGGQNTAQDTVVDDGQFANKSVHDLLLDQTNAAKQDAVGPEPNDAEEHISSIAEHLLDGSVDSDALRNMTPREIATVEFPNDLNVAGELLVDENIVAPGDLVAMLWSGPVQTANILVDAATQNVKENLLGSDTCVVKYWAPAVSVPSDIVEVLARREVLVMNYLRNTPGVAHFVGFMQNPMRFITRQYNSVLSAELHDPANEKWNHQEIKQSVISDLINGLLYIHGKGIIHNRFSPKAVMLSYPNGPVPSVHIADFSSAMMVGTDPSSPINSGAFAAMSYRYVAPEILTNLKPKFKEMTMICSQATDIFSFGMTVYEIATRNAPFGDLSEDEARLKIIKGEQPKIRQSQYQNYAAVVSAATQRDADARPADFLQVRKMLGY